MRVSEAFLVNTQNFETIINALAAYDDPNPVVDTNLIEYLGYSDPNDLLVVRLLKDLKVIQQDGSPGIYFKEFQNTETTRLAIAKGLLTAYAQLFEDYPFIHKSQFQKVNDAFKELFGNKKTDLIIKYITGTFLCIVSYCGIATIDRALKEKKQPLLTEVGVQTNGTYNHTKNKNGQIDAKVIDHFIADFTSEDEANFSQPDEMNRRDEENDKMDLSLNANNKETEMENNETPFMDNNPLELHTNHTAGRSSSRAPKESHGKQEFIQKALIRKSVLLYKMKRWEALLPALDQIIDRYNKPGHENMEEVVSRSIIHRAITLLNLKRPDQALPALDAVIEHFRDSERKEFYDKASMAMLYKAEMVGNDEDVNLLPLYNSIIQRLHSFPSVRQKLDAIHLKRFDLIMLYGTRDEALDASIKLIERFKDDNEQPEYLQKAMIKRAEILDSLNRDEQALQAYDDFLTMFG